MRHIARGGLHRDRATNQLKRGVPSDDVKLLLKTSDLKHLH